MKSKTNSLFSLSFYFPFLMLLVLPSTLSLFAQTIAPQKLPFDRICAGGPHPDRPGEIFNEFQAFFKISGFDPSVTFVVELSDPSGSFLTTQTATTTLPPLPGTPLDTPTDKTITFAVPTNLVGSETYQLRVKSSTGIVSQSFNINATGSVKNLPVYFKAFNAPFFINNKNNSVSFCNAGSVSLSVYNPTPSVENSSPGNYPQLKYNWYKNDVLISGQTGSSLSVNTEGVYYAELNYGPCTDVNFSSQRVTVTGVAGNVATITSTSGNPFCSSIGNTTLSVTAGNTYVWKKDNVLINGANAQTYQTNLPGIYTCDVDFGGCSSTSSLDLKIFEFSSTISGVEIDQVNHIQEGETRTVSTTTTAVSPTYQWLLNDGVISNATQSTLNITAQGNYKVIIAQTSGCQITKEFNFELSYKKNLNVPQISNIVTPNGDGINDTWIIPDQYISGTNTQVMILSSLGEIVFQTDNYDNYNGWPQATVEFKNFNPVYYYIITPAGQSPKKGSITLIK